MSEQLRPTRTRFAPSPTGYMHVGGVRTALFAWLIARQNDGQFILRIEDTDKNREQEGSTQQIIDSLHWLGIQWDEGVDIGGPYVPYLQSERKARHHEWAQKLIDSGRAYADPRTPDELDVLREDAKSKKRPFLARNYRPETTPEWHEGMTLRFKSMPKAYTWQDAVMGQLSAGEDAVDDFIIIKSDGLPTYNFAHICDDADMDITHILRSSEFIASTPKFLNLYEALEIEPPIIGTLPYVMAIDGKKKLGKRDGAKDILAYQSEGYLPETLMNFLATLGWNDGTEQEVFTRDELIEKFSLARVQKSPARFDEQRLLWLNGQHIRLLPLDELYERVDTFWPASAASASDDEKKQVLALVQDRLKRLTDLPIISTYFFEDPTPDPSMIDDNKQLRKAGVDHLRSLLESTRASFETLDNFTAESIQDRLNLLLEETGEKPGILFSIIRLGISWAPFSPALNETLAVLGKETTLRRLRSAIDSLA